MMEAEPHDPPVPEYGAPDGPATTRDASMHILMQCRVQFRHGWLPCPYVRIIDSRACMYCLPISSSERVIPIRK